MHRKATQSHGSPLQEQLCPPRPLLLLQRPVSQVNVVLPDRIRFFYPAANGRQAQHQLEVQALGENAHGVCFLTGICHSINKTPNSGGDNDCDAGINAPAAADAFRMDLICGLITRMETGERMTLHDWERRVRRCFAMDSKTDALPLSSMLISSNCRQAGTRK